MSAQSLKIPELHNNDYDFLTALRGLSTVKKTVNLNGVDVECIYSDMDVQYKKINKNTIASEGVVYTPRYICQYIINELLKDCKEIEGALILDPCVGGGAFVIELLIYLHERKVDILKILPNIYCYDINSDRINEARQNIDSVLKLLNIRKNTINFKCEDFLTQDCIKFDYILGNPPYINSHNLTKKQKDILKSNFKTTQQGNANISYAFIEKSCNLLKDKSSKIGFILPNNLLHIKSANELRKFLHENRHLESVIDFGENMPFKPVRTYNAILFLSQNNAEINFTKMTKVNSIQDSLHQVNFEKITYEDLHFNQWRLISSEDREKIKKIESLPIKLGSMIKTGIATLRDDIYIVSDNIGDVLYKTCNGESFCIEKEITKIFYKLANIDDVRSISQYRQRIIFPYVKNLNGATEPMSEEYIAKHYPMTYKYLLHNKDELLKRDAGKIKKENWFLYGRSQGLLSKSCRKIFFKTFNGKPNFFLSDVNECLFSNGYCIECDDNIDVNALLKLLNSNCLDFYIRNTSYSIEGGYYCYQKKYLENFGLSSDIIQ